MSRDPNQYWGKGDPDALFDKHPVRPAPFPRASRRKDIQDYDQSLVKSVLQRQPHLVDVDPRTIHATQPQVTRAGVSHYQNDSSWESGSGNTFRDQGNAGNKYPVVYDREDGQRLLLSGHHRATVALLNGKTFKARHVEGPWGPPR